LQHKLQHTSEITLGTEVCNVPLKTDETLETHMQHPDQVKQVNYWLQAREQAIEKVEIVG
jgi:hypothetical protein